MMTMPLVKNAKQTDVIKILPILKQIMSEGQLCAVADMTRGEEGQFFRNKMVELAEIFKAMPKTYETDGQGKEAVAYLHFFKNDCDWYITEKDIDSDNEGQIQAFGLAKIWEAELGYINIKELQSCGVEVDLYWNPKTIGEIRKEIEND